MQTLWMSWKDNANCGSKLTNVVVVPEKCSWKSSRKSGKENHERELIREFRRSFGDVIVKAYLSNRRYSELKIGDPARNITEMIFQKALINPSRTIKRVLKVKNSIEILERFEKYREKVKANAYQQQKTHPRSTVDGNELLRFYGTTMSCCSERSARVSEICRDPICRVCRMIQCNFNTEYNRKNGILLSTHSDELTDNVVAFSKRKTEKAVVVCRIIAGTVADKVDGVKKECECIDIESKHFSSESLIVRNPSAVLPCFVIVFS